MIPDTPLRTANHAEQLMAIEVFSELLAATDPRELSQRLTEQLRELTGARTVALLAHPADGAAHALIHVCPARRATLFGEAELGLFCSHCTPAPLPNLTAQLAPAHPLRDVLLRAGVESLVRIPLRVRDEVVSTLVLLDLPEPDRIAEAVTIVTRLAPVIALALKNAFAQARIAEQAAALQNQTAELECRVAERTAALEEANRSLAASRLSALNLMEDAVAARRRAEETSTALQHSEALFRRTFDEAPIGAAIIAPDGIFRRVNTALCHFLGYLEAELIGRRFSAITFADDLEESRALVQRLLCGEIAAFEQEKRYVRKDGTVVWGRASVSLVRDPDGRPLHLAPLIQDITARKQAEEALRRSEQRYATTLAAVNDGLWEWNVATGTAYFSPLYYTMLGYRDEAFVANYANWRALVHPEDVERVEAELRQSVAAGLAFSIDLRMKTATGEWRWVCTRGNMIERDPQGQARLMVGTLSDASRRKQAEAELHRTRAILQVAMDQSPAGIAIADAPGGELRYVNDAGLAIGGGDRATIVDGVGIDRYVASWKLLDLDGQPLATDQIPMVRALTRGENARREFIIRRGENDDRTVVSHAAPIRDDAGRIIAGVVVFLDLTELKHAERTLEQFFTLVPDMVCIASTDGHFLVLNDAWERVLGYTKTELMAVPYTAFIHPEDLAATSQAAGAQQAGQPVTTFVNRYRAKDGSYRWLEWNATPVQEGNILFAAARDITEHRRAEEAIRESEVRYRTLADSGQALIWTSGLDKKCNYFNQPWLDFTGRRLEQEIGDGWTEGVHPEDFDRCVATYVAAFERREKFSMDYRVRHREGDYRWIQDNGSPRFDSHGEFLGYIGHCLDITERKRAEEERRQSHELLAKLAAQVPGVVYQYQLLPDGRACFPYASPGMRAIYELDPEEVRDDATPVLSRLHPEDTEFVMDAIGDSARTLEPFHCEFRVILPHQGLRWRLSDAMPERLPDGGTLWYGIISDITERRQAEEALRASLHEKEALLKEVHHRVKNNLQIISSLLRLQSEQTNHPAATGALHNMQGRIRSMALLHETLYRSGDLARVNLADYLESVCTQLLRAHQRTAGAIDLRLALAAVELEATQAVPCGLLVNELVSNALKHAFPGGRPGLVHVELQVLPAGPAPGSAPGRPSSVAALKLRLAVTDDGVGLPTGLDVKNLRSLGLQLVSDLARQLQGDLTFGPSALSHK